MNTSLQNKLVKLIGSKPIFKCSLEGAESDVLMDSGSQVAAIDDEWLSNNAPKGPVNIHGNTGPGKLQRDHRLFWSFS